MAAVIVAVNLLAVMGLALNLGYGYMYLPAEGDEFARHVYFGLFFPAMGIFGLAMLFFYFIGTGNIMRNAMREYSIEGPYLAVAAGIKSRLFPWAFISIVLIIGSTVMGGGTDTGSVPKWMHGVATLVSTIFYAFTVKKSVPEVMENNKLLDELAVKILDKRGQRQGPGH